MTVAYDASAADFARELKTLGFDVVLYKKASYYDAFIYRTQNFSTLKNVVASNEKVFLLNVDGLTPLHASQILNSRTYSPIFSHQTSISRLN